MPRKPTPDGKRVHVNVRLSDAEAEAIDAVRGDLERGPWMREKAVEEANRIRDSRIRERLGIEVVTDDRQPPGTVSLVSAGTDRDGKPTADVAHMVNVAPEQGDCPHPKARINKGLCGACGTYVGK